MQLTSLSRNRWVKGKVSQRFWSESCHSCLLCAIKPHRSLFSLLHLISVCRESWYCIFLLGVDKIHAYSCKLGKQQWSFFCRDHRSKSNRKTRGDGLSNTIGIYNVIPLYCSVLATAYLSRSLLATYFLTSSPHYICTLFRCGWRPTLPLYIQG